MIIKEYIGKWGIGINRCDNRVYIEYQEMDESTHNEYDIRLYMDGNFPSKDAEFGYAKTIATILSGESPKLKEIISVSDFGASLYKSDNTEAFVNAIAYAQSSGDTIMVPAGNWHFGGGNITRDKLRKRDR
jgi:hypothetical protein